MFDYHYVRETSHPWTLLNDVLLYARQWDWFFTLRFRRRISEREMDHRLCTWIQNLRRINGNPFEYYWVLQLSSDDRDYKIFHGYGAFHNILRHHNHLVPLLTAITDAYHGKKSGRKNIDVVPWLHSYDPGCHIAKKLARRRSKRRDKWLRSSAIVESMVWSEGIDRFLKESGFLGHYEAIPAYLMSIT